MPIFFRRTKSAVQNSDVSLYIFVKRDSISKQADTSRQRGVRMIMTIVRFAARLYLQNHREFIGNIGHDVDTDKFPVCVSIF